MNVTGFEGSLDNSSKSVFCCPSSPHYVWDLKQIISLQLAVAVTAAACPFTILLNILVIVVVKKTRELQTNSNILISSLAVADLLVGAVSMPLTITLDALILLGTASEEIICMIKDIAGFVLYTAYGVSFQHLTLIAWERYVAIVKWKEYQVVFTKRRLKKYASAAWIAGLIPTALYVCYLALAVNGVRYEILLVLDALFFLGFFICLSILVYFYCMVFIETRKRNRSHVSQVSILIKARIASKIAYTVFLLTVTVFIFGVPTLVVTNMVQLVSFFRANSVFRWAEIFLQMNSLVNPALYFYRNNRYRTATLRLLRFGKPQEIEPVVRVEGRVGGRRDSVASVDVVGLRTDSIKAPQLRGAQSYAGGTSGHRNTGRKMLEETVMERSISTPFSSRCNNLRDSQENATITVQIERAPRKKPEKKKTRLSNSDNNSKKMQHLKITRSKSWNDIAFSVAIGSRQTKIAKANSQRRHSAPYVLAIESGPEKKNLKASDYWEVLERWE